MYNTLHSELIVLIPNSVLSLANIGFKILKRFLFNNLTVSLVVNL
jgi:hypothetical protein